MIIFYVCGSTFGLHTLVKSMKSLTWTRGVSARTLLRPRGRKKADEELNWNRQTEIIVERIIAIMICDQTQNAADRSHHLITHHEYSRDLFRLRAITFVDASYKTSIISFSSSWKVLRWWRGFPTRRQQHALRFYGLHHFLLLSCSACNFWVHRSIIN